VQGLLVISGLLALVGGGAGALAYYRQSQRSAPATTAVDVSGTTGPIVLAPGQVAVGRPAPAPPPSVVSTPVDVEMPATGNSTGGVIRPRSTSAPISGTAGTIV
jgi:hypothetical protein